MNVIQSAISAIRNKASQIFNDDKGWIRGGKFTPVQNYQDIQRVNQQAPIKQFGPLQVPNFQNPQVQQIYKPITPYAKKFGEGFGESSAFGLIDIPNAPSQNLGQKVAYGAGFVGGILNPLNPINKAMGALNIGGKAVSAVAPRLAGKIGGKIIGGGISELAQAGAYTGAQRLLQKPLEALNLAPENQQSFGSNLAFGLAGRGLLSGQFGGAIAGKIKNAIEPYVSDFKYVNEALQRLETTSSKQNFDTTEFTKLMNQSKAFNKTYDLMPEKDFLNLGLKERYQLIGSKLKSMVQEGMPPVMGITDQSKGVIPEVGGKKVSNEIFETKDTTNNSYYRAYSEAKSKLMDKVNSIGGFKSDKDMPKPLVTELNKLKGDMDSKYNVWNQKANEYLKASQSPSIPEVKTKINLAEQLPKSEPKLPWEEPSYLASNKSTQPVKTDLNKIRQLVTKQTSPKVPSVNSIPPKEISKLQKLVPEKVNLLDYFRTPDRVLQKIGLGNEAETLKRSYNSYLDQLPKEIGKITGWYDQVKADPTASKRIFQYLDGYKGVPLNPTEKKIAGEIQDYLKTWADKLDLPQDNRVTNYITHIFDKDFIKKDFDEDLAKIISERVPGSVYDPFTQQRLGKEGYIEDVFKALDAYVKRATRKVNMDPALMAISKKSDSLPLESWKYVKSYIDRVNLRPTDLDTMVDNLIKQSPVGYKLGQRPLMAVTRPLRQAVYRGTLGLNVGSAVRNLTQGVNTYAKLGEKWTAKGYLDSFKSILTKGNELEAVGVLRDTNIQDRQLSAVKGLLEKADKGLFSLFEFAEKVNRGSAYFGAKAKALSQGLSEQEAVQAGIKMARDTQFTFGSVDTPLVLSSDLAKTLGQFQSFNLKQTEFLTEMIKKKEFLGAVRWLGANVLIMATVGKLIGYDLKDLVPFYGIISGDSKLGETPPVKITKDIYGAVVNVPDKYGNVSKDNMLGRLGDVAYKDLPAFIPGGVQAKKTIEGIKAVNEAGSYSKTGLLQYPIEQTKSNYVRAGLFGKSNLEEAKKRWNSNVSNLGKVQTAEYKQAPNKMKYYQDVLSQRDTTNKVADIQEQMKTDLINGNEVKPQQIGSVFVFPENGEVVKVELKQFSLPEKTGDTTKDSKAISSFKSSITTQLKQVDRLITAGAMPIAQGEELKKNLESLKAEATTTKTSSGKLKVKKAKKPKKIKISAPKKIKVKKLTAMRIKKPKKLKLSFKKTKPISLKMPRLKFAKKTA